MATRGSLGRLTAKVTASLRSRRPPGPTPGAAPAGPEAPSPPVTSGVEVSYAPERDGSADPGEVVWSWVPYEDDPGQGKDRPVLIVGWDGSKLAGVPLSTKDHSDRPDAGEWVPVGTGAWDREGRPSFADASRLLRIDPAAVRREGAAMDEAQFEAVLQRVARLHDWVP